MKAKIRWAAYRFTSDESLETVEYFDSEYDARKEVQQGRAHRIAPRAHYQQADGSWTPR